MRSGSTKRLLTALLLLLTAFGAQSAGVVLVRFAATGVYQTVKRPGRPQRVIEPPARPQAPPRALLCVIHRDERPATSFVPRVRFQRPPPATLLPQPSIS